MSQYITVSRAKEALRSSYDSTDDNILSDIVTSASSFLDTYCQRTPGGLGVQTYDELYNGTGSVLMYLNNTPVISISRLATVQLPALYVRNNDNDMGCRATAQVTATGLTLTYIKNAVTTTNTLTWASYPTVTALVNAINGLGNHWQAGVQGGFGGWSTTDLRATQGAFGCRIVTAYVWIWWYEQPWYITNEATGELWNPAGFTRGVFNWRATYTAGFINFPQDLAQALAELVAATYYARETNANMQSESLGPYSYSQLATKMFDGMSPLARNTFSRYKQRRVPKFSTW